MKAICALVVFGLLQLGAVGANAGVKEGRIVSVLVLVAAPDRAFVKVEGNYSPYEPSCSVGVSQWDFAIDISGTTGKAMYSLALAAQASGSIVTIGGTDTCVLRAGYEDLQYIHTNP